MRLQAADSEEITVDLSARFGELKVSVLPGDATIYIDGQARGTRLDDIETFLGAAPP